MYFQLNVQNPDLSCLLCVYTKDKLKRIKQEIKTITKQGYKTLGNREE
jgi:hypothetical protein